MPGRNGKGPMGNGQPGRGLGPCGAGGGNGRRRRIPQQMYDAPLTDTAISSDVYQYSKDNLKARKAELEEQLNWINNELNKEQ
ncbi:MAG: hypothetical protein M0Q19_00880 [Candidatus Cloacimonetes bacterium]|nr:hypothetical protein [Candidatus Cloacimonadota bacterium]MCK9331711.1 hypothetical protein [Candidatus Cloacimonadota bacterium]MDD4231170.1 hypothetical protein [Candidatus Cloacimonadota bacterium]MDY0298304.1 hypothetical protein [Candidatus Cloacimonadaceae bacterium]